jgi:hypothetical protein
VRAEFEWFPQPAGCLRLWHDDHHGYGDPFQWAATARWLDVESIEIMGVYTRPTDEMMAAIKAAAALHDAVRVGAKRIKPDRTFMRWHRVDPSKHLRHTQ